MTREIRTLFLLVLTLLTYVFIGFLKDGSIVFPYPLNSFFFLIVLISFISNNPKQKLPIIIIGVGSLAAVLSNPVLWETLLSAEQLEKALNSTWIVVLALISLVFFTIWGAIFAQQQKHIFYSSLSILGVGLMGWGVFTGDSILPLQGLLLLTVSGLIKPVFKPYHYLWAVLLILEFTKWISNFLGDQLVTDLPV